MADNKTCGNCASYYEVRPAMGQGSCFFDELDEYGCAPLHDGCEEACESWEPKPITAEERCQQLEQLAREMYKWCAGVTRRNWTIVPERVDAFREKLEELGVSLDG